MANLKLQLSAGVFLACGTAWGQLPPNTGPCLTPEGHVCPAALSYQLGGEASSAFVVTNPRATWGSQPGAFWMGTSKDSTDMSSVGVGGNFPFTLTFCAIPPRSITMSVLAVPDADPILLGSNSLHFDHTPGPGIVVDPNTHQQTTVPAATVTIPASSLTNDCNNKLTFLVSSFNNFGGLNVLFSTPGDGPATGALGANPAHGPENALAAPDPVDSASGQFYATESDIELGGPMDFAFRRYYSSQLSNGKVSTALGTNWMSSFDALAVVSATNAQVLMFGGKIVSFTNSGGAWQLVAPKDILYQFIQSGAKYQFLDPRSNWIYTFLATGALTTIADRNGNTLTVTPGTTGPTQVSDGAGRTLAFTYAGGQLAQVTDQAGRTVSFVHAGALLASVTDVYKQTTKYSYTGAAGLMTQRQLPLGNIPTTQTYDSQGRVLTQADPNNHVTKIAYDGTGGTTITDPLNNVTKHLNDTTGDIKQMADPTGSALFVTYDTADRRTSFTDKVGNRTTYASDQVSGKRASITDALGNTTAYTYASQTQGGFTFYNLSNISYPDGTSARLLYDTNGNVLSVTARDGTMTSDTYDSNGRITSFTDANGKVFLNTWNADSTKATATDPLGNKTSFTYDSLKRLTGVTDPNGGKTGYVYDKSTTGPMLAAIRPGGGSTTIYDDQNRQVQDEADATGGVYHSDYTGTGQIAAFTDPLKNKITYSYDADDRLSAITSPAGEAVSYTYDSANRRTSVFDANGPRVSYTYTSEGNVATSTDGGGRKSSFTYDVLGRIAATTTPGGNKYARAYDKLGRVISRTNPLGEVQALTRDAKGRLVSVTMPGAITTTLKRDAAGRIIAVTSPNGNAWAIGYDALERPSKITDPLGQATSLTYTGTFLTGETLPLGTLAISSDPDGRITKRQYSDGTAINTAYDGNGLISSTDGFIVKRDAKGQPTNINGIGITLDPASRPAVLTYASGKAITYAYDKGGRLASVADWVGGRTTLAYDEANRLASLTYPNGVANTFTYDADGRVAKIAVGSIASITLLRDTVGKVTAADRNLPRAPAMQNGAQQLTYDAAGQLTSATSDAMGRVTALNGRGYTWNLASQLTSFTDAVNSATFTYDGLGELSSTTSSGVAQTFVYNYLFHYPALSIVRKGVSDLRYYVYLPDGSLLYSIEAADNTRRFYHFDEMGNTMLLTDDAGGLPDSYVITPYGEIADHLGATDNPFTWQGKYGVIQEGQGLFYVRARHYDASAARFISRDPEMSADPRSSEPYTYAAGNPLRFIDPFGTDFHPSVGTLPGASDLSPAEAIISADAVASGIGLYVLQNYDKLGQFGIDFYADVENAIADNDGANKLLDWKSWARNFGLFSQLDQVLGNMFCDSAKPCSDAPATAAVPVEVPIQQMPAPPPVKSMPAPIQTVVHPFPWQLEGYCADHAVDGPAPDPIHCL